MNFIQRIKYFVVNQLVGVVPIVRKDVDASPLKMLKDSGGAGGGAGLPVIALADDVVVVCFGLVDKSRKFIRLGKICVIGISVVRKDFNVDVGNADVKDTLAYATVINSTFSAISCILWGVKADDCRIVRKAVSHQISDCFA